MKQPRPSGTPIDVKRRSAWRNRFGSYRYGVTEAGINDWLDQFDDRDKDLAARLLDSVEFISAEQLHDAYRAILTKLPGWDQDESKRQGRFAFVSFASSAGESGDGMIHEFRLANGLNRNKFNELFIGKSDIVRARFGPSDTVVFIDDFVGTGNQGVTAWQSMFQELTAEVGNVYLATVAAYKPGADRVNAETRMQLLSHRMLNASDGLFNDACTHYSKSEKSSLLTYCRRAHRKQPLGWGDCGLVIVLYHQCPNNSLAALHASSDQWEPLFPRS